MTRTTAKDRRRRDLEEEDDVVDRDELEDDDGGEDEGSMEDGGSSGGVFAELKNVASDAALSVLAPVAKQAATSAAKFAVKKGPQFLEETVKPAIEDAGGVKGLVGQAMSSGEGAGGMLSKLTGGGDEDGGGDAGDGTGKGRRMPVQQAVDVAAPIDVVYDQWTQFEDYPKFMHRVQRVEQRDDSHVAFHAKVWGINRMWEAEIVEQRPDERIVFKSVNGVQLTGVVTFHDMAERLTHIELNIDVDPNGPIEKIARGTRVIKRAARADLKRFKAFVEMHEDETGAWRGEIQDSDVVSEPDEDAEDEYYEDDEAEASADEEEYDEDEQDEEEEPEEEAPRRKPRRQQTRSRKPKSSNGGDPKKRSRSSSSKSRSGSSSSSSSSRSRSRGSKNGSSKSSAASSRKSSSRSKPKSRSKAGGRK
jgi:uncharacterized membrane protein